MIQFKNERLTDILQASGAAFYDRFNTIFQFIKPFLDKKKMSIFEEYGAFKILCGMASSVDQIRLHLQEQSDLGLHCLSVPFCQALWSHMVFKILEHLITITSSRLDTFKAATHDLLHPQTLKFSSLFLTLLMLNTSCPVLANSVAPDQHCLSLNMWISIKNTDQVR